MSFYPCLSLLSQTPPRCHSPTANDSAASNKIKFETKNSFFSEFFLPIGS
ncbi:hypothetical protein Hanom_Chr00s000071g01618931 [Helianthus anomalus]